MFGALSENAIDSIIAWRFDPEISIVCLELDWRDSFEMNQPQIFGKVMFLLDPYLLPFLK